MINFRMLKLSDPWLWVAAGSLLLIGLLAIFSTTFGPQARAGGDLFVFVKKQLLSLVIGASGLILFSYLDYRHLKKIAPVLYVSLLFLLALTILGGSSAQGAQRWLQLGPISFQPSEIAKLIMIVILASSLDRLKQIVSFSEAGFVMLLVAFPFLLIFRQPDLGTALVFYVILIGLLGYSAASSRLFFFLTTPLLSVLCRPLLYLWLIYLLALGIVLFLSRARFLDWGLIFGSNVLVGLAFPVIWGALKLYQKQRILTFLNPAADPYGAGYHSLQSIIAIGSGGLIGKGYLQGTQTQLQFIPEQHSDFIFSAVGEEFGFLGAFLVVFLFFIYVRNAFFLAANARDRFGAFLAAGIGTMTLFHVLANIGMAIGLLPVVGVPLPFLSYGGSSLFMNLVGLGILQSIAMRRQKLIF